MNPNAKVIMAGPSPRGWHRLQQAAECLQKYAFGYEDPTHKKPTMGSRPALAKGSLLHLALAQHYAKIRATQQGENPDDWADPMDAVSVVAKMEKVEDLIPIIEDTYDSYQRTFVNDSWKWKILEIEQLNEVYLGGKYRLTGRMDLVIEVEGGQVYVIDHKSTGRATKQHQSYYAVSGQLMGYSRMMQEKYKEKFAGVIVNLVQLQDKAPAKFDRIHLPRSPAMEARFEQSVIDIEENIERLKASGRSFDNWPKALSELTCYSRYGACEFIDQCRYGVKRTEEGDWTWAA